MGEEALDDDEIGRFNGIRIDAEGIPLPADGPVHFDLATALDQGRDQPDVRAGMLRLIERENGNGNGLRHDLARQLFTSPGSGTLVGSFDVQL
jgi:hypothetical protein